MKAADIQRLLAMYYRKLLYIDMRVAYGYLHGIKIGELSSESSFETLTNTAGKVVNPPLFLWVKHEGRLGC